MMMVSLNADASQELCKEKADWEVIFNNIALNFMHEIIIIKRQNNAFWTDYETLSNMKRPL